MAIAHGDVLLADPAGDVAGAEALFERAAALARARAARMVELEALTRLAAVRRGRPEGERTLRRLRRLYEAFTEGFGTQQLAAARVCLEEL